MENISVDGAAVDTQVPGRFTHRISSIGYNYEKIPALVHIEKFLIDPAKIAILLSLYKRLNNGIDGNRRELSGRIKKKGVFPV